MPIRVGFAPEVGAARAQLAGLLGRIAGRYVGIRTRQAFASAPWRKLERPLGFADTGVERPHGELGLLLVDDQRRR
jgi:hypothetical protein